MSGPPTGGLKLWVLDQLFPHVLGVCSDEPDFPILLFREAKGADVGLPVNACCQVPGGNGGEVFEYLLDSGHEMLHS